uniref:Putative BPI/LBP family protein At1g04970 isoform X1 n=1 Tax=Rhizophora mucronata TaxID=61149 RepID=A0A2P2JWB7_RHIMU
MAPTLLFLLLSSCLLIPSDTQNFQSIVDQKKAFTSIVISQKGLDFVKDLLITRAISSVIPLTLPNIEKTDKIPFLGNVNMVLSNFTIDQIHVPSSYVKPGDTGVAIIASGTSCNLTMNWYYEYNTWLFPLVISDRGKASVRV